MAQDSVRNRLQSLADKVGDINDHAYTKATDSADRMGIMDEVRLIGGALVFILLIVFVLNEVYNSVGFEMDDAGEYVGPFGQIVTDLETTGMAAMGLLVLGFLVIAASAIMSFFGGSGFGAR
jgi:uncharacterized membrane protein YesL